MISARYLIALLVVGVAGILFFYAQRYAQIEDLKRESIRKLARQLRSSASSFEKLSQNFYNDFNDEIAEILSTAEKNDPENRRVDALRQKLLDRLYPSYRSASLFGLRSLHVFDAQGRSFLRVHRPKVFGEDLKSFRHSIAQLIEQKRMLQGFEAGHFVAGFRYLYPLFYDGEFVGGFEWVWSHDAFTKELRQIYHHPAMILLRKSAVKSLPSDVVKQRYQTLEACQTLLYPKSRSALYAHLLSKDLSPLTEQLCRKIVAFQAVSIPIKKEGEDFLLTLLPLKDFAGKPYGYLLSHEKAPRLGAIDRLFAVEVLFWILLLSLIHLLLYRSDRQKIFVRTLLDAQRDLILLTDGKEVKDANRAFLDFFGCKSVEEFVKRYGCVCNFFIPSDGYLRASIDRRSWMQLIQEDPPKEHRALLFDRQRGEVRIFLVSINRFKYADRFVVSLRDITEVEREKRHFKLEAMVDYLTGIYNKRSFEEFLQDKIVELRHSFLEEVTLVMFDIDHFKQINDRYGHNRGDEVLQRLANLIRSHLRKSDFLARWGGEEFLIVMINASLEIGCKKGEELCRLIERSDFELPQAVTCSFGVARLRSDDTIQRAIERVDRHLYRAKESGRNRVVCEEPSENRSNQK